jgi:aminopeptidase N
MKYMRQSTILLFLLILMSSCAVIGINNKRKTPLKPGKYPEFTLEDTLRGKLTHFRSSYDVSYYDINIDVDIKNKFIKGYADICFKTERIIDTIQIDLYENLKINKIVFQGRELQYYREYKAIFILFNEKIQPGENCTLTVHYEGKPVVAPKPPWEGGFVWKKDKDKKPWIGVACELAGASLWWPLKDHLSDEPDSLKLSVTIPGGLFCVGNGKLTDHFKKDNKETFVWKTNYPINSYNVTLYIGNYQHFQLPYPRGDTVNPLDFYVLPYNLEKAKAHFQQAVDILQFYESAFGEYPWWQEGYKLVESPYAGMEHQTAIAYGDKYKNTFGSAFDYIILHETAHEWWGNSISVGDYAEIWLHEGFATYSEALYVEYINGHKAYLDYLSLYSIFIKNKRPMIGPYDVNFWDYKDTDVYMKGALTLHTLRNILQNDTLFFDIIKTYYNRYKYSIVSTRDFINIVNEKTKGDWNWFFNQYLYSRICPQLEWNFVYNTITGQNEFRYKWNNVETDLRIPVIVKSGRSEFTLFPGKKIQVLALKTENTISINTENSYISLKKNKSL